jgi:hypothetical protein
MQTCTLCEQPIVISGSIMPNTAIFECAHQFHLNCIISYSKQRLSNTCPTCVTSMSSPFANFGEDRLKSMQALIDSRRRTSNLSEENSGGWGWFKKSPMSLGSLVKSSKSLHSLKLDGFLPEDMAEEGISWSKLSKVYTTEALLEFGFTFEHMKRLGFTLDDFKKLKLYQLKDLGITASDMMQTEMNIQELATLNIPLHELHAMGFQWTDLVQMGGDVETLRAITDSLGDLKTYFEPDSWTEAGFTTENIQKYEWDTSKYTPARKKSSRPQLKVGGMVF